VQRDSTVRLGRLQNLWWRELGLEDTIPETTRDTKAILVIGKVVLKMVSLELAVV